MARYSTIRVGRVAPRLLQRLAPCLLLHLTPRPLRRLLPQKFFRCSPRPLRFIGGALLLLAAALDSIQNLRELSRRPSGFNPDILQLKGLKIQRFRSIFLFFPCSSTPEV